MLCISIDGACRRNGQPNCVAAAGLFIQHFDDNLNRVSTETLSTFESESTNQRGELWGLIEALRYINTKRDSAQIITDSEYLYNAITKEWCQNWERKGWTTSTGDLVKNGDLWSLVLAELKRSPDISCYHIKGHVISFGKVTAATLLVRDPSAATLHEEVCKKFDMAGDDTFNEAYKLFQRNHGFNPTYEVLRRFITANIVADAVATQCVEKADALSR